MGRLAFVERPAYGLVGLLAALGAAAWRFRIRLSRLWRRPRRVRRPAKLGSDDLAGLLTALDAAWARKGFTRPDSRGPLEHLATIPASGIPEALRTASREGIDCLYRAHFGAEPLSQSELEDAADRVTRAAR